MKNLFANLTHTLGKWNVLILAIAAANAMTICCSVALAQSGAGSIQGTVTDTTRAVIPGASIHVVNRATSVAADTKSNRVGFYQVPGLFTGVYTVTISTPGMKTYEQTLDLLVDQTAIINAALTVGDVAQQVVVTANIVQLTTTDSGVVGSTLENARINQLPMNGRDLLTLTNETTPGMDSCAQSPSCANGMMPGATDYVVDGAPLDAREFGGASAGQTGVPDPDSVQEVKMETSGVGAQFGTPAAGVITTKSGTNQLHGTIFETARNNAFGIAKQRQDPANYSAPHYVRNEFGASLGGPIVIPHLYDGKNKSFFFFAYERYSLANASYVEMTTPTMAMRNGDWSGLVNASGVLQQLYDPATTASSSNCNGTGVANKWCRAPFTNNQIPIGRLSPTAKAIYAITPQPTSAANPLVTDNLSARNPSYVVAPTITFRLDHEFNENNRAYLRYTSVLTTNTSLRSASQPATIAATVNGANFPAQATGIQSLPTALFVAAAGFTHIFSPTFFSETVVSQQWLNQSNFAGGSPNTNFEAELGTPNNFGETGFPDFSNNLNNMNGTMYQYGITQIIDTFDENLTKTQGRHQMQFGGRYRHERFGYRENQQLDKIDFGDYATALENPASGANYTATTNTGYADADQFLGAAQDYVVNLQPPYIHFHDMEFDGYFQDNYHVAKNLTLNLGVRYEAHPAPLMKNGTQIGFDLKNDAEVLGASTASLIAKGYTTQAIISNVENDGGKIETTQEAGIPSAMTNNYDLNILPRFGIAWQPFGDRWGTVLRGGYGRYIYPIPIYFSMASVGGATPFEASYTQSYVTAAQSPDGLPNYLLRSAQTVTAGVNSSNVVNSNSTNSILPGMNIDAIDPDDAPDLVTQANVTLEQPMKGNSVLRVSWIYSHDANLWNFYQFNNHPANYIWEMQTGTVPPTGGASTIGTNQYSTTATGPYDKITWGGTTRLIQKTGWSTDNALQVNYQRLFHHGIAYQVSYVWSKAMDTSGETGGTGITYPFADFINSAPSVSTMTSPYGTAITPALPQSPPAGTASFASYKELIRFENYKVDTNFPKQHIKFNGIVDLPFGRGKRYLSNVNRFVDELVGGFQIAGAGNIVSQDFAVASANWGPTNPLQVYKHKVPITDCRSGVCYKEYEWFNGYVAPTANANVACTTNCVSGLPASWVPYQTPIDSTPGTTYYGDNEVNITLPGKAPAAIAYSPISSVSGGNPFSKTILSGPINWTADASLFKVFPIKEQVNLRLNVDAFNLFNVQGQNNPNTTDGTQSFLSSYNPARQMQLTLRLTF